MGETLICKAMNTKYFLLILISIIILIAPTQSSQIENISLGAVSVEPTNIDDTPSGEYYAIIIGIDVYSNINYSYNGNTTNTARLIYTHLLSADNWEKGHIRLLLNENATKENIKKTINDWLAPLENEKDVVLLYFIGDSYKMPLNSRINGNAYIVPYDAIDTSYSNTVITDREIYLYLEGLDSSSTTVIFDTEYSGLMHFLKRPGITYIASNGAFPQLFNKKNNIRGLFSQNVIQGLTKYTDENNDGWVSTYEAFTYAKEQCINQTFQMTLDSIKQRDPSIILQIPHLYNYFSEQIRLFSLSFGWKQITDNGFGKSSNYATRGMEIFNGELYIGTQNNLLPNSIDLEHQQSSVAAIYLFPDLYAILADLYRVPMRIIMHFGTLASQGFEIWKYNYSTDTLTQVIGTDSITGINAGFDYHFNAAAAVMKVFKGYLYVGTWNTPIGSVFQPNRNGCELWRTSDGIQWEQVVGHNAPFISGGFGNPDNTGAWSIEEFNGYLYVGTMNWDFSDQGGCEIWRSVDGLHWEQVVDHGFRPFMTAEEREKEAINTYAWIMQVYKGQLYLGTFNARVWLLDDTGTGCQLWRTSDGMTWEKILLPNGLEDSYKDGFGESENYGIRRMVIYNDELYIGIASSFFHTHGCEIWKYDGVSWVPVISDELEGSTQNEFYHDGFGNQMNKYIWSMVVTNDNKLWVGTANCQVYTPIIFQKGMDHDMIDTETQGCEIWCYDGQQWQPVIKNDFGNKPNGLGDMSNLGARSMIEYPENSGNIVVGTFKFINPDPTQPRSGCELWIHENKVE